MTCFALGFLAAFGVMLVWSVVDRLTFRYLAKRRFDREVERVLERDLTYRSEGR